LGDAMHGDRVLARIERRDTRHAPGSPARAEGRIVKVLGRTHPSLVFFITATAVTS
jgi:exoribonuclease R